jgi:hypothetical protein
MNPTKSLIAAVLAVMFLGACSSSGGLGDILGGSNNGTSYQLNGTVDSVDASSRSIWLTNVSGYNGSMLSSGGGNGNTVRVYYDDQTSVEWQGRSYRPQDLERGDQVAVRVDEQGNTLVAETMTVTYNSAGGMTSGSNYPSSNNYATIRGTVRSINTSNRTIQLESTSWRSGFTGNTGSNLITISYDTGMGIDVNGQVQSLGGLERGDVIDVQVSGNNNSSSYWAQRIWLVRDIRQ